jgi:hypothetical protein
LRTNPYNLFLCRVQRGIRGPLALFFRLERHFSGRIRAWEQRGLTPLGRHRAVSPLPASPPLLPPLELHAISDPTLEQELPITVPLQHIIPPQVVPAQVAQVQEVVPAEATIQTPAQVAIQDPAQVPDLAPALQESGPRRSYRLAIQSQGLYVSILEKALKKKKREDSASSRE